MCAEFYLLMIDAGMCAGNFVNVSRSYAIFYCCRIRRYKLPAKRFLTAASWQEDKVATTLQADKVARQGRRAGNFLDCLQNQCYTLIAEPDTINCLQRHLCFFPLSQ